MSLGIFNRRIRELEHTVSHLQMENDRLTNLNKDLDGQVREVLKNAPITEYAQQENTRIRAEHERLIEFQGEIALFFRVHFADEIARGEHSGVNDAKLVCRYLQGYLDLRAAERERVKVQAQGARVQ